MSLKEYIVTLSSYDDLQSFYDDMETPGGSLYIPDRAVDLVHRRPVSRNTHYMLTAEEAEQLKADTRVLDVELNFADRGVEVRPSIRIDEELFEAAPNYTDTENFSKNFFVSSTMVNWGLLRSTRGTPITQWGSDGTTPEVTETITVTASGKNVDVVIVDGLIDPTHPEFAVNADGTGGSRVVQYNWYQNRLAVEGLSNSTYVYTPYVDAAYLDNDGNGVSDRTDDNDHGCHVAGTAVGNTHGWARDANIYNISPYSTAPSYTGFFMDHVRYWHNNKPINPATGRKNPTVTNHSYGYGWSANVSTVSEYRYRGTVVTTATTFSSAQLQSIGVFVSGSTMYYPLRSSAIEADYLDAINDGIIMIGAAGNEYTNIASYSASASEDYNNYVISGGFADAYMRGSATARVGFICVGSAGTSINEYKSSFSNCGPRVDVYAPGSLVMSSVNSSVGTTAADPRNASYRKTKKSGTSMASPQVCGVLACLAETWPNMKQADALTYITSIATTSQLGDTAGGYTDYTALQGSPNKYLYFYKQRPIDGEVYPKVNQGNRPATGLAWPRPKIYRYGR
jgi:hypothetical protein